MIDHDMVARLTAGLNHAARDGMAPFNLPPRLSDAVLEFLEYGEGAILVVLLAGVGARLRLAHRAGHATDAAFAVVAAAAGALLYWQIRFPSPDIFTHILRGDHIAFCVLAGTALARLPAVARIWSVTALSACFLLPHTGVLPFAVVIGGVSLAFLALNTLPRHRAGAVALVQGGILATLFACCWWMRSGDLMQALRTQGLFAFVLLRHVSFVIEVYRGRPGNYRNYLCYMLFYPCCIGSSEIYGEFCERNLDRPPPLPDYRLATRKIVFGGLQVWLARQMLTTLEIAVVSPDTLWMWMNVLLAFVRSALFLMGLWATIEGIALLYGFTLRPNFARILSCQNPAEFWHSWRATMTNWLIHYVYIPLGGNRRHQSRNILAAFAVSTLWHCMGIPFLAPTVAGLSFLPVVLWGALNAIAVVGYVHWHRQGQPVLSARTPTTVRRAIKVFLTVCLGTFTVTLLGFTPQNIGLLPGFLRILIGLAPG